MKITRFITTFLLLFTLVIFISHASVKYNNCMENFIDSFEKTNANFKFYNMNITCIVPSTKSEKEIKEIGNTVASYFGVSEDKVIWDKKRYNNEINIYAKISDNFNSISFKAIKKNNREYYIIIDILNNKVYKNIVDIYQRIDKYFNKNSDNLEISTCIVGEYTKNLQLYKCNDILENILYNMNAKQIDRTEYDNFISVTGYSDMLLENNLKYLENKINLNIGFRYSENENKTLIYMATPIIKLDY